MTSTPAFSPTTIALASAGGVRVKGVLLPNGNVVVAHAFADGAGTVLDPVKDATVQAATAAIIAAVPPVQTGITVVDAFGATVATSLLGAVDAFGKPLT